MLGGCSDHDSSESVPLSFTERERLAREILDEIFGLGPLEPLLKDMTISDILVNRYNQVYIERAGKLEATSLSFKTISTSCRSSTASFPA